MTTLEFQHLTDLYGGTNNISADTGPIGPLYYAKVDIEGSPVEALVDPGSAATLISFNLFKQIGRKANIPSSVMSKPAVLPRDYNQCTIPVGASVDLTISFNGQKVVAPVYICSPDSQVESCLLGTYVDIPLGLMVPTAGVEPKPNKSIASHNSLITATVHLVDSTHLPGRAGTVVEVRTSHGVPTDVQLLFEPGNDILQSRGLAMQSSLLELNDYGSIHLLIENPSAECQELPCDVVVGSISVWHMADVVDLNDDTTLHQNQHVAVQNIFANYPGETIAQRRQWLADLIRMSGDGLTTQDIHLIQAQILQYHDVEEGEYGKVDIVKHHVNTEVHSPINQPLRRIPYAHRTEMLKLVQSMLQNNIIQPSVSPWSSPVVLVKKKDGTLRFCIEYRRLNSITRKDIFSMPRIDDMVEQLKGKKVFTTLDDIGKYSWTQLQGKKQLFGHTMVCMNFWLCHSAFVMCRQLFKG